MTQDPPRRSPDRRPTVTVTGHGIARAAPDRIVLTVTLDRTDRQIELVEQHVTQDRHAVLTALRSASVPDDRIRSLGMQVSPHYEWEKGRHAFRGFRGIERIVIRVPITPGGNLALVRALAGSLEFAHLRLEHVVREPAAAHRRALEAAVTDARARAKTIARAAGGRLGAMVSWHEGSPADRDPWPGATGTLRGAPHEPTDTVAAADLEIEATVTGVWEFDLP